MAGNTLQLRNEYSAVDSFSLFVQVGEAMTEGSKGAQQSRTGCLNSVISLPYCANIYPPSKHISSARKS